MPTAPKILAFAGSLRAGSYNKKLIQIAIGGARDAGAEVTYLDLRDLPLPLFDEDSEKSEGLPANARKLKDLFLAHRGLLISSPEYNSSFSGVFKNTIDWVSRPVPGEGPLNCFVDKVAGLVAASPGALGGLRGLVSVRMLLGNIRVLVLPDQATVAKAHEAFKPDGTLVDDKQQAAARKIGANVAEVVGKLQG